MESRSSPRDKNGAYRFNQGMTEIWKREKNKGWVTKNKGSTKTELVVDNNLLWRSKAYSFGHFICNLCGDPAHVQDASSSFPHQHLLLIAARDINFYDSFTILKDWQKTLCDYYFTRDVFPAHSLTGRMERPPTYGGWLTCSTSAFE